MKDSVAGHVVPSIETGMTSGTLTSGALALLVRVKHGCFDRSPVALEDVGLSDVESALR